MSASKIRRRSTSSILTTSGDGTDNESLSCCKTCYTEPIDSEYASVVAQIVSSAIQGVSPSGRVQLSAKLPNGNQIFAFGSTVHEARSILERNVVRYLRRIAPVLHTKD